MPSMDQSTLCKHVTKWTLKDSKKRSLQIWTRTYNYNNKLSKCRIKHTVRGSCRIKHTVRGSDKIEEDEREKLWIN